MGIYEDIGVRPVINAIGTATRFGGALMAPEVLETMRVASRSSVSWTNCTRRPGKGLPKCWV